VLLKLLGAASPFWKKKIFGVTHTLFWEKNTYFRAHFHKFLVHSFCYCVVGQRDCGEFFVEFLLLKTTYLCLRKQGYLSS
jgi:hypothetical protein